jgi:hypothetical protein
MAHRVADAEHLGTGPLKATLIASGSGSSSDDIMRRGGSHVASRWRRGSGMPAGTVVRSLRAQLVTIHVLPRLYR